MNFPLADDIENGPIIDSRHGPQVICAPTLSLTYDLCTLHFLAVVR